MWTSDEKKYAYAVMSFDKRWCCTYADPTAEKLVEKQRAELLGKSALAVFPDFELTRLYRLGLQAMQQKRMLEYEEDSVPFHAWTRVHLYPTQDGLLFVMQEIARPRQTTETQQTRQEQKIETLARQLQQSQEQLHLLQKASNIGIFEWDIQTGKVTWMEETELRFGLQPGEFGGTIAACEKLVHPDDIAFARAKLYEAVEQKTFFDLQFRVIWPDKSIHWMHGKARTFYDQQGKPLRMLGINIDITDRKRYEEESKVNEEKMHLFAESNIIGFSFSDIFGNIYYANDAYLNLIGYSREDLAAGKIRWTDLTSPEMLAIDQQKIAEAKQKGACTVYEKEYIRKDGSRANALIGYLLLGEKREQAVVFTLDITDRKRLEKQKDEFLGVVSHELRTPVTSLKAFAQVLEKRFKKAGDQQNAEFLMKMDTQINKLTKLIEDLIDITRVEAGQLQLHTTAFELMPLVDEIVEEMQRTTTQQILIKEDIAQEIVWGDRDRIGQVITNLLSNAIKYSPQADTIFVKVSTDNKQATVSIQDFGMGIPQDKQEQIFQRFYRVDEKKRETIPGMGLGLYISAEMIKRHGGNMWFESEVGYGSTFSFNVPLQKSKGRETDISAEKDFPITFPLV